jgi:hypothetical protein
LKRSGSQQRAKKEIGHEEADSKGARRDGHAVANEREPVAHDADVRARSVEDHNQAPEGTPIAVP